MLSKPLTILTSSTFPIGKGASCHTRRRAFWFAQTELIICCELVLHARIERIIQRAFSPDFLHYFVTRLSVLDLTLTLSFPNGCFWHLPIASCGSSCSPWWSSCCSWCSPWCSLSNAGDAEKTENHCGYREFSHRLFLCMFPSGRSEDVC